MRFFKWFLAFSAAFFLIVNSSVKADQQNSADIKQKIEDLKKEGKAKGWTFTVGYSKSLEIPEEYKTGLIIPKDWKHHGQFIQPTVEYNLPKNYDWRDQTPGGLTPIRNQGNCGSCWAFSTAATFADGIKIKNHVDKDISEQNLVSCNPYGYSCGGGWWVHDMHEHFGMVPEKAFPYEGEDLTCPANLPHEEKLDSWSFVGDVLDSQPSVTDLKNAIYTYGPISVAVAAVGGFSYYTGGIYNDCSGSEINHAVNLVGWNDDGGYWIMRNSWGADWGEKGYMRIKYECNQIGYAATIAAYKPTCTPQPKADPGPDVTVKYGQSVVLGKPSTINQTYSWSPSDGLSSTTIAQPKASPTEDTEYMLTTKTACGKATNTVRVKVIFGEDDNTDDNEADDSGR